MKLTRITLAAASLLIGAALGKRAGAETGATADRFAEAACLLGTPRAISKVPNLEKAHWASLDRRFLAPAGNRECGAGQGPFTSSATEPAVGDLEMITDGNKAGTDGTYVELGPGRSVGGHRPEAEFNLYAITVWHYHKQGARLFQRHCAGRRRPRLPHECPHHLQQRSG
jgi:hypothetical protein